MSDLKIKKKIKIKSINLNLLKIKSNFMLKVYLL